MHDVSGYVDVPGGRLWYEVTGIGQPLVLMNHPTATLDMWEPQVPILGRHARLIRYDLAGQGRSESDPNSRHCDADDLARLLSALEVKEACILGVGGSGTTALDFALAYPRRATGLILVDPGLWGLYGVLRYGILSIRKSEMLKAIRDWGTNWQEARDRGDVRRLAEFWVNVPGIRPAPGHPEVRERLLTMICANGHQFAQHSTRDRYLTRFPRLRVHWLRPPTLLLTSGCTPEFQKRLNRSTARSIRATERIQFPNNSVWMNLEDPETFNAVVLRFLQRIEDACEKS